MSAYPNEIITFRERENLPNVTYDVDKKTTIFNEDFVTLEQEVIAIESTLGENPQGEYDTVVERLDNLPTGGGPIELVGEAEVTGSSVNILTVSDLDLDADKYYEINILISTNNAGSPVIGWRANSDTNPSNYRLQRLAYNGASVSAAAASNSFLGVNFNTNTQQIIKIHLSKKAGAYTWGYTDPIVYNTVGTLYVRQFGIAHVSTDNLTAYSLTDEGGGSYLAEGTKIRVFKVGF